jgi:hypothetical protein
MGVYGSNYDYGDSPLYKDEGPLFTRTSYAISFWYNIDQFAGGNDILMSAVPNSENTLQIDGANKLLEIWKDSINSQSISMPAASGWHFVLIQYDITTEAAVVSFDLGAPNQMTTDASGYFDTLLGKGFVFMPYCPHPIYDFRIYKPTNSEIFLESQFTYYYNDILAQGQRTVTIED